MSDLKIGVIGSSGLRGGVAREAHKPDEGSRVVATCDIRPEALKQNKEWYGDSVFTTDDYHELLKQELDAVLVCTPDFLHEEHTLAAIEAGVDVFLEKPMAISIEGCDKILVAAREKGVKVFVGHNMRYMSIIRKMREIVQSGAIGRPKSIWVRHFIDYGGDYYFRDWHSERKYSNGLLIQKGSHDIDVMHWITGADTKRVSAFGNLSVYDKRPRRENSDFIKLSADSERYPPTEIGGFSPKIDVEDQNVVIMEMENGILGSYMQCHFTPDHCRNYTIIGDEGRIENIGDTEWSPIMIWNRRGGGYRTVGDEVAHGYPIGKGGHDGSDGLIIDEFLDYVRTGCETTSTPQAARMAVAVGCRATESMRSGGGALDIPPLP